MQVFWNKGYEGASIQNLVDHMGVQRGSLYAAFGDKHTLFMTALKYYVRTVVSRHMDALRDPRDGVVAIKRFFYDIIDFSSHEGIGKGCLITNSAAELADQDQIVAAELRKITGLLEESFHQALVMAQTNGELGLEKNPRELARYLVSSLHGLRVTAKLHRDPAHLDCVVHAVLSVLD